MKILDKDNKDQVVEVEVNEAEFLAVVEQLKNGVDADNVVLNTSKGIANVYGYRRGRITFTVGECVNTEWFCFEC